MKILYLFTSYRGEVFERAQKGDDHGVGFWGMQHLAKYGIDASYAEVEQSYSWAVAKFLRRILSVYWIHVPVFFRLISTDIVFTSTAFGTQLLHTLFPFKRSKWVMHDFSIMGLLGKERTLRQRVFAFMVNRCAGIVTLGKEETDRLENRFPHLKGKIEFIPFGTNLDFFKPMEVEQDGKVFAVGFDPDRDWKTLIEAVRGTEIPLTIATRPQRVEKLDVPSSVSIKQFTPKDLAVEYAKSEIIVIPMDSSKGINDAMGCSTLFEAMATGKPVVATATHTMKTYVVDGENGLLVPEGDAGALRSAIERLRNDPELRERLGSAARKYAEERLDAVKLAGRLAEFFGRV